MSSTPGGWEDLLSVLGVPADATPTPMRTETPPPAPKRSAPSPKPVVAAPSSDWNSLASDLGIQISAEPAHPIAQPVQKAAAVIISGVEIVRAVRDPQDADAPVDLPTRGPRPPRSEESNETDARPSREDHGRGRSEGGRSESGRSEGSRTEGRSEGGRGREPSGDRGGRDRGRGGEGGRSDAARSNGGRGGERGRGGRGRDDRPRHDAPARTPEPRVYDAPREESRFDDDRLESVEPRPLAYDDRGDTPPSETIIPSPAARRLWDDEEPAPRRDLDVFSFIDEKFGGPPPKRLEARLDHDDLDDDDSVEALDDELDTPTVGERPVELDENGLPKKRRRRRRRGGRGARDRNGERPAVARGANDDAPHDDAHLDDAPHEDDVDALDREPRRERAPRAEGEAETDEPRRRRRRRRSGGRKPSDDVAPIVPVNDLTGELHEDLHEALDMTRGPREDDLDDMNGDRQMHREVVPWKDAIGILIGINMEARAKSPRGDQRRGGGNYRRGNNDRR